MDARINEKQIIKPNLIQEDSSSSYYCVTKENTQADDEKEQKDKRREQHNETEKSYTYTATEIIGSGTFGVVYKAVVSETSEVVAIKKVFQDKRFKNRELQILPQLRIGLHSRNFIQSNKTILQIKKRNSNDFAKAVLLPNAEVASVYPRKRHLPQRH